MTDQPETREQEADLSIGKIADRVFLVRVSQNLDNLLSIAAVKVLETMPSTQTDNKLLGDILDEGIQDLAALVGNIS